MSKDKKKHTLDERVSFHNGRSANGTEEQKRFSMGFVCGVDRYNNYGNMSKADQAKQREFLDNSRLLAGEGDPLFKGVMAGTRAAANARKSNIGKKPRKQ